MCRRVLAKGSVSFPPSAFPAGSGMERNHRDRWSDMRDMEREMASDMMVSSRENPRQSAFRHGAKCVQQHAKGAESALDRPGERRQKNA
eukprot:4451816-Prymnesium_polylepis.1